jgi:methyl-accepting chemotaxis protein
MPHSTARFYESLLGRMVLYVILPMGIIWILVILFATSRNFANLRRLSEERLIAETSLVALQLESGNRSAIGAAKRMAEAQVAGMFGQRQMSIDFARLVLEDKKDITAAYFGYAPNADKQDAASLVKLPAESAESIDALPAESMDATGRFIPYWFRSFAKGNQVELEPCVDMDSSLYYKGVKETFERTGTAEAIITEPYVYRDKMIVEQVYPIVIEGKFAGVAGVDRALKDVERDLRRIAARENVDLFLVSSGGTFIAATSDPVRETSADTTGLLKTQAVAETVYGTLFNKLFVDLQQTPVLVADDPMTQEPSYFVAAAISTGGWKVVLREPERRVVAAIWRELRVGVSVAILAFTAIVALLMWGTFRLTRRIKLAVEAADQVARGDLTREIEPGRCRDETGRLLHAAKAMMENLNNLVGKVKRASIQLNSTATELAATGHQQEATARSFGASTNEMAAALKENTATGAELVQTMDQVSEVATGTATLATEGHASLQDIEANMRGLDQATGSIAEKLAVINEKASNITGIVTTITKVADQTNLLSVNAAIEAEKAGEYGVGFLVVAREIRRLADQTASSTLDIEQMVQQMQSAVSTGVMEMDRFTDQVRRAVDDVGTISQQMGQIIERVDANSASFKLVNESMVSQSQGAEQISDAMEQLTLGVAQTREALKENAQAADDLHAAIGELKTAIASFRLKD